MKMNNIVLVCQEGIAVVGKIVDNELKFQKAEGPTNIVAQLVAIKGLLASIPTNEELIEEPVQILIGDKSALCGLTFGSQMEYLRTGKTAGGGKEFTEQEFELLKEVCVMLAERSFNVKLNLQKFATKEFRRTIEQTWNKVKAIVREQHQQPAPVKTTTVPVAKTNPVVEKLEQLMTQALDEGDFDKYDKLEERLNKILAQDNTPVVEEESEPIEEETNEEKAERLGLDDPAVFEI